MAKQENKAETPPKRDTSPMPLMLTPSEKESLRQDKRESIQMALRLIKAIKVPTE